MGEFFVIDKSNFFKKNTTHWKFNMNSADTSVYSVMALVEGAQLITPDRKTLTFKEGSIISMVTGGDTGFGTCLYRDHDLV